MNNNSKSTTSRKKRQRKPRKRKQHKVSSTSDSTTPSINDSNCSQVSGVVDQDTSQVRETAEATNVRFAIDEARRLRAKEVNIRGLSLHYGNRQLLENAHLQLHKGHRSDHSSSCSKLSQSSLGTAWLVGMESEKQLFFST